MLTYLPFFWYPSWWDKMRTDPVWLWMMAVASNQAGGAVVSVDMSMWLYTRPLILNWNQLQWWETSRMADYKWAKWNTWTKTILQRFRQRIKRKQTNFARSALLNSQQWYDDHKSQEKELQHRWLSLVTQVNQEKKIVNGMTMVAKHHGHNGSSILPMGKRIVVCQLNGSFFIFLEKYTPIFMQNDVIFQLCLLVK